MENTVFSQSDSSPSQSLPLSDGFGTLAHLPQPPSIPDEEAALGIQRIGEFQVGFGAYSDVWKAEMTRGGVTMSVALKVLRLTVPKSRLVRREEREKTWRLLQHDNITPLYAMYRQPNGSPVFASQWYENGTADEYLRSHPDVDPMLIIYEIISGMEYLHGKGIVHGDLKGSNVLIDDGGHARLIDFGLSRYAHAQPGLTTCTPTTLRWCSPELLRSDEARPTMQSDVYACASTVLELLSGNVPYNQLGDRAVALQILNGVTPRSLTSGFRYNVPRSAMLWDLMDECWTESSRRPAMRDIRLRLSYQ